jgi:3-hydroxyacyl-[acyl-carrier-protein] dehydratase
MRFHLIDRVESWEPGRSVRGRKLTSLSEEYWERGDGGELEMPPPFVLEALCQAGTWLIMITTERRRRAALLSVGTVQWLRPVRPGDVLVMDCEVQSMGEESVVVSGRVTVDDDPVLTAEDVMCALIAADELDEPDEMERLQRMLTTENRR